MIGHKRKESIIKYKLLYTGLILLVYLFGKNLPLYGIDISVYADRTMDAETMLVQAISGDIFRCSVFALGISPYMIASILVQVAVSLRGSEERARISPRKKNRVVLSMTFVFAIFQALFNLKTLSFTAVGYMLWISQCIAVIEMVTGVMMIIWLSSRNARYGIGGQSILIFVNILDGIIALISGYSVEHLVLPAMISMGLLIIIVVMENAEERIPVQRISIHNIYADKNYMAIKLNPIGVMPVMFSTAFFMLPQLVVAGLGWLFPENESIIWWMDNLLLSKPVGAVVYILILYALTIGFSRVFLNPAEITEQFLKSGDSIPGVHAGRDTKRYLSRRITRISFFSATVLSLCLGIPMAMQLTGYYDSTLAALPSSIMMLVGVWCNIYREAAAIKDLDSYRPFI